MLNDDTVHQLRGINHFGAESEQMGEDTVPNVAFWHVIFCVIARDLHEDGEDVPSSLESLLQRNN